eukprot:338084-Rhodomonas_salina.1
MDTLGLDQRVAYSALQQCTARLLFGQTSCSALYVDPGYCDIRFADWCRPRSHWEDSPTEWLLTGICKKDDA